MDDDTVNDLFKNEPADASQKMGEAIAEHLHRMLTRPGWLGQLVVPLPAPPYDLVFDGEHTHYAGFVLENTRYVRACGGESIESAGPASVAPTCLACARLT